MDRQQYKEYIGKFNGQCKCPALKRLFEEKRKTGALEKRCIFFKRNADLGNPQVGDEIFLEDYRKEVQEFTSAYEQYRLILTENIKLNQVNLTLHDVEKEIPTREIPFSEAEKYICHNNHIVTCFCASCKQQIDILT